MKCQMTCDACKGGDKPGKPCEDKIDTCAADLKVSVVLFKELFGSMHHFHGDKFEAFLFEAFDDFTDKSSLDGIGLEHDKGSFTVSGHFGWVFFKDVFSIVTRNFLTCCYCKKSQTQSPH